MRVAFCWLSKHLTEKTFMPKELSRNQSILCFDVILQHDWPIKQCLPIVHVLIFSYIG